MAALNMTGFIINMTELVSNMTGFVKIVTAHVLKQILDGPNKDKKFKI